MMKTCLGCGERYEEAASVCPLCDKPYSKAEIPIETDTCGRVLLLEDDHSLPMEEYAQEPEGRLSYAGCISGEENGYAVTGCLSAVPESLVIPDSHMGKPVLQIGRGAFKGEKMIKTVFLPNGLREISDFAFEGCTSLRCVSGGKRLMYIGEQAFRGCVRLERFEALLKPELGYPYSAFAGCYGLHIVNK